MKTTPHIRVLASGGLILLLALLPGCNVDLDERAGSARAELTAGRFDAAIASVDATLAEAGDEAAPAKVWALQKIRVEALARAGRGSEVASALEKLRESFATQITPELYLALAQQVREAAGPVPALDVLSQGDQRFPGNSGIVDEIDALKALGEGDEDLENRLESLGYL